MHKICKFSSKLLLLTSLCLSSVGMANVLDLQQSDELDNWIIVNDTVMGGRSSAQLQQQDSGLLFTGRLSRENNGGFASIRRKLFDDEFANCSHIQMLFKADLRPYKLRFRTNKYIDGAAYEVNFKANDTKKWQSIRFSQQQFKAYYRSRLLWRQEPFALSDAKQLIIMAATKERV